MSVGTADGPVLGDAAPGDAAGLAEGVAGCDGDEDGDGLGDAPHPATSAATTRRVLTTTPRERSALRDRPAWETPATAP
jgi:hypothetical protein